MTDQGKPIPSLGTRRISAGSSQLQKPMGSKLLVPSANRPPSALQAPSKPSDDSLPLTPASIQRPASALKAPATTRGLITPTNNPNPGPISKPPVPKSTPSQPVPPQLQSVSTPVPKPTHKETPLDTRVLCLNKHKGTISFSGKTSFAEGHWYGVTLDEPNGKNDGSVKGIQYFHCEPSCGLFVRQHQIEALSSIPEQNPPNGVLQVQLQKTPVAPRGVSQLKQPSSGSPTVERPPSVNANTLKLPYVVADRVMVGGKKGIVRYIGNTQFAKGIWTGVELEVPDGKNNGTIEGIKYFTCAPKHGLFAPVMKVTPIPNSLPNLHVQTQPAPKRTPPSGSSLSSTSSARHTAIRERPNSRNSSSSMNSAGRTKRADSDMELEGQISGLINKLEEVNSERASLEDKLAMEKNVREDLQFSLDEHAVTLDIEGPRTPGILREKKQEVEILHGTIRKLEQGLAKAFVQLHNSTSEAEELRESLERERKYSAQLEKQATLKEGAIWEAPPTATEGVTVVSERAELELRRVLSEHEKSLQDQAALEETVCNLKKQLNEQSEQLVSLETENKETRNMFEKERGDSITELSTVEGHNVSMKVELSSLREKLANVVQELEDRDTNLVTMSLHLSKKDSVIEDMKFQFDQATEDFDSEREDLQAPLNEIKMKNSGLEDELARVKRDLRESESLYSELAKYKARCVELEESMRASQEERTSVLVQEEEFHRLQQELANANLLLKQRGEESAQQQLMLVELEDSNRRKNSRLVLMEQNYLQNGDVSDKFGNESLEDPLAAQNYRLEDDLSNLPYSTTPDESMVDSPTNPWGQQTARPYCDICEIFDSHDTEDCPIQNENNSPEDFQTPKLVLAYSEREYCEVCEMFGHTSESCDTQETF